MRKVTASSPRRVTATMPRKRSTLPRIAGRAPRRPPVVGAADAAIRSGLACGDHAVHVEGRADDVPIEVLAHGPDLDLLEHHHERAVGHHLALRIVVERSPLLRVALLNRGASLLRER